MSGIEKVDIQEVVNDEGLLKLSCNLQRQYKGWKTEYFEKKKRGRGEVDAWSVNEYIRRVVGTYFGCASKIVLESCFDVIVTFLANY